MKKYIAKVKAKLQPIGNWIVFHRPIINTLFILGWSINLTCFLMMSGCSHAYVKDGATTQEFYQASTDCKVKAKYIVDGEDDMFNIRYNREIKQCMAGHGWNKEQP